ncbi:MAG: hypothetical protein LBP54_03110 [Campylobacteraceae bacterium]|jgi:hypothetical protein|nr:hypothetical protein [Campylobacteraceae bacterium]
MAFVNEVISKEDYEKYNLGALDKRRLSSYSKEWAIDREKKRWLKKYHSSIDIDNFGKDTDTTWDFYRNGYLISVKTKELKKSYDLEKKEGYKYIKILELKIPQEIEGEKEQMLKDFKEAFEASFGNPFLHIDEDETCKIDLEYEGELT